LERGECLDDIYDYSSCNSSLVSAVVQDSTPLDMHEPMFL